MTPETIALAPLAVPPIAIRPGATPPAIAAKSAREKAPPAAPPGLILMGRDERGRAHASVFTAIDTEAASRAAELMGLRTVAITEALRPLAADLPQGRLFASGKGLVPFVKANTYQRLLVAAGMPDKPMPLKAAGKATEAPPPARVGSGGIGGSDGGDGAAAKRPVAFDQIGIGSVVLACQGPQQGWWEAVVVFTKADDRFVLQWRDFPDDGEITRARKDLGLLPPDSREGLG